MTPAGGQGANMALEDAAELAAALAPTSNARAAAAPAAAAPDMDSAPEVSLHGVLREWQLGPRLDRTSQAQISCFLVGHASYGEAQLAQALDTSGISHEDLQRHRERFPSRTGEFMMGWRPSFSGPLNTLAPEAEMVLARGR